MTAYILASRPIEGLEVLTLNRPDKLNALCTPLLQQLAEALDRAEDDPAVRVVALTGAGGRAFAAGADIAEYRGRRTRAFVDYSLSSRRLFDRLEALSKPTIAAIHGYALGGGLEIALCCDVLIMTPEARIGLPEGLLGLCPGGGGTQRLIRSIGRHATADILLSGNRLSGDRAYALGLAAELVAADGLDQAVRKKAERMMAMAPQALTQMKRLVRLGADAALPAALSLEQEVLFRLYETDDAQEGIDAFLDKREPRFTGD